MTAINGGLQGREEVIALRGQKVIKAVTWNIAAVNNNPFEYWITNEDLNYNKIMSAVSSYIDSPGDMDVLVNEVFTDEMFDELADSMMAANITGVSETRIKWKSEYRDRKVISQFIKDGILGKKRLISMPDRVTNTINTVDGAAMRPSVINCYNSGDLGSIRKWWFQWKKFMFKKKVLIKKKGVDTLINIKDMITTIKRSKYPSITKEEEKISIPLQIMCVAIFDSILIDMMNKIDNKIWQPLRDDMCNKLNRKKVDRTMEILEGTYGDADVQFLQEVASSFAEASKSKILSNKFDIYFPASMDSDRDQNSFILLKRGKYKDVEEVTSFILNEINKSIPVPIANGDLNAIKAVNIEDNMKYIFASFHGDTNGLATIPIVTAVHKYSLINPEYKLLFGLDANTYKSPDNDQQGMVAFAEFYTSIKLNSCYGPKPNPNNFTTFHARTHLQPQLNKAVRLGEKDIKGDKNPKDFILFFDSEFTVVSTGKDNTGAHKYIENMVFPTLSFPSDHGVTSTTLIEKVKKGKTFIDSPYVEPKTAAEEAEEKKEKKGGATAPKPESETKGAETAETAGAETVGTETAGAETVGTETAGAETAGAETAGAETAVTETKGAETETADTVETAETAVTETEVAETETAEETETEGAAETLETETAGVEIAGGAETETAETRGADTVETVETETVETETAETRGADTVETVETETVEIGGAEARVTLGTAGAETVVTETKGGIGGRSFRNRYSNKS